MKIMISQPMRGKNPERIRWERETLVKELQEAGHYVIDTVLDLSEDRSPIYYLAKSIELLDQADAVVFMRGWQDARGCRIEYQIAKDYGKFIMEV